jgi:zinc protease
MSRKTFVPALAAAAVLALVPPSLSARETPWSTSGIDWSKPPPSAPAVAYVPPVPVRKTLKNGLRLLVVENHRVPLVSLRLVVDDAGWAMDPAAKSGLAAFTADLLDEGAGPWSAEDLARRLDRLGAELDSYVTTDSAGIDVEALARNLDDTLAVLTAVVTAPTFVETEVRRVHGDRVTALKLRPDRPRELAEILLRQTLFGETSAYGRPGTGRLAAVETLTAADARAFYAERWQPAAMTLVVVGDVNPDALVLSLDQTLGAWTPAKGKKPAKISAKAKKRTAAVLLVDRPGAEQADVRIGVVSIDRKDKRDAAVEVTATLLGGTFTSRLNRRLREELGWTYGIRASHYRLRLIGWFGIGTALVTSHASEGIKEALAIVGGVRDVLVGDDELNKVKMNSIRDLPSAFATNSNTADAFADLIQSGRPDDWYAGYEKRIAAVTAKDVQAVAKALLGQGKLSIVVVGDAKVLAPELEALGLGKVTLVPIDRLI